jgi:Zn-dependent protease
VYFLDLRVQNLFRIISMIGTAGETPFDVRFNLRGIPVRIHPIFWLSGAMMFWNPERMDLVALGVISIFISVLVHELGHAMVLRHYGWPSEIVLFFMGGYATATRLSTWRQIWSLAAGPLAGLALAFVIFWVRFALQKFSPDVFSQLPALNPFFDMLLFSGIVINLMNLIPALPLDGGQIMATLVNHYGRRGQNATVLTMQISIASAGAVALWCAYCLNNSKPVIPFSFYRLLPAQQAIELAMLQPDPRFMMLFFGILCAQGVIAYNNFKTWR